MNKRALYITIAIFTVLILVYSLKNKFPIKKGSIGPRVLKAQKAINTLLITADNNIDFVSELGVFDTETEQALNLLIERKQLNRQDYNSLIDAAKRYENTGIYDITYFF